MNTDAPSTAALGSSATSAIDRADLWLRPRLPILFVALCALGLAVHGAIVAQAWSENPFASAPQGDAKTYWDWAGRVAGGEWLFAEPFHAPPLYPYLLGLLRIAGGGLLAVYVVQAVLHVATAAWIGWFGALRFRPIIGVVATLFYLALDDATFFVQRVSAPTLQAFLAVWLWWELEALATRASRSRSLRAGAAFGLSVLANPMMLPALLVFALWLFVMVRKREIAAHLAAITLGAAALTISPAPVHNWLACRELIPVSTQGGLAFAFGNAPGADGTYHPIEGISTIREQQDRDALTYARAASGKELGWNGADRFFYRLGMKWRAADPAGSVELFAQKVHWFFTGRNYSDSYLPRFEIEQGFASRLAWAFVRSAWLVLPACVALCFLVRKSAVFVPALMLFGMPLVSVVVLHYSSRYRVPAMPMVSVLASSTLFAICDRRTRASLRLLGVLAFAAAFASGPLDRALDFDTTEKYRPSFEHLLGATLLSNQRPVEAAQHLRRALELGETRSQPLLAEALRASGDASGARAQAELALSQAPTDPEAARVLAIALAETGEFGRAAELFARALELDPENWQAEIGLGSALLAQDRAAEALVHYDRVQLRMPDSPELFFDRGMALAILGREREAEAAYRECLRLAPELAAARSKLVELWLGAGRYRDAAAFLRDGLRAQPDDANQALNLAWILAVAPDEQVRDGGQALALITPFAQVAGESPEVLDVLAAALAESGRYPEAVAVADRAVAAARAGNGEAHAVEIDARAARYRAGQPFRLPVASR